MIADTHTHTHKLITILRSPIRGGVKTVVAKNDFGQFWFDHQNSMPTVSFGGLTGKVCLLENFALQLGL